MAAGAPQPQLRPGPDTGPQLRPGPPAQPDPFHWVGVVAHALNHALIGPEVPLTTPAAPDLTPQQAETKAMRQASQNLPPGQNYSPKGQLVGKPRFAATPPATHLPGDPNVAKMQQFLNTKGYNLTVDGIAGPQTRAAAAAFRTRGPATVKAVQDATTPAHTAAAPTSPAKVVPPTKNAPTKRVPAAAQQPGTQLAPGSNPADVGQMINPSVYANAIAGAQFNPTIHDLQVQQARQPVQAQQNAHDIANWYDQVINAMKQAGTNDASQNAAAQGAETSAVQRIIASLGGAANQGSGLVGAAGADQVGNLAALGQIDRSYHNDMAPLLRDEAAGQLTGERNRQITNAQDITNQIADAQGQKGQVALSSQVPIIGQNNALAQQRFANNFGIQQAIMQAQIAAGQNAVATAKANQTGAIDQARIAHMSAQDAYTRWKMEHPTTKPTGFAAATSKGKVNAIWNDVQGSAFYTANDLKNGVITDPSLIGQPKPGIADPKTGRPNVETAVQMVNNAIRARGFNSSDPAARSYRDMLLKSIFHITPNPAWEKNW